MTGPSPVADATARVDGIDTAPPHPDSLPPKSALGSKSTVLVLAGDVGGPSLSGGWTCSWLACCCRTVWKPPRGRREKYAKAWSRQAPPATALTHRQRSSHGPSYVCPSAPQVSCPRCGSLAQARTHACWASKSPQSAPLVLSIPPAPHARASSWCPRRTAVRCLTQDRI